MLFGAHVESFHPCLACDRPPVECAAGTYSLAGATSCTSKPAPEKETLLLWAWANSGRACARRRASDDVQPAVLVTGALPALALARVREASFDAR